MITLTILILTCALFGGLFDFALRASWGLAKIVVGLVILPFILIGLIFSGLFLLAFPVLIIVGILALVMSA